MKTVLITGCSSGIGRASALACAQAGMNVVATMRTPAELSGVDVITVDVTNNESIVDGVAYAISKYGRLDALVNNAGVAGANPTCEVSDLADIRLSMEVNFFGAVAMSRAALPHLRVTKGRLLTISSIRGVIGQPFNEGYSASKFAIEGFMEALAPVAAQTGVAVTLIEPSAVLDTEFVNNSSDDVANMCEPETPYEPAFSAYRQWVRSGAIEGAQKPGDIAEVVVQAIIGPTPPFRLQTSDYGRRYVSHKLSDVDGSRVQAMTTSWISVS